MTEVKRTKKPCPGCGEGGWLRDVTKVCGYCQELLDEARAGRKAILETGNREVVPIPDTNYMCPAYYTGSGSSAHPVMKTKEQDDTKELQNAMVELARVVGEIAPHAERNEKHRTMYSQAKGYYSTKWSALGGMGRCPIEHYLVKTEVVDAMTRLDLAIRQIIDRSFYEGRQDGVSIIKNLASGELSINEFNERSMGKENK